MTTIFDITDVVELRTWATDQTYSITALKEDLEAILPDNDTQDPEDLALQVFEELERRRDLISGSYPFTVDGNTINPNERKQNSSYLFCLGLRFLDDIPSDFRSREFETIVKDAASKYFCGEGIRIGAPWRTDEIREYSQLLEQVVELIPELGGPARNAAPAGGDGGWDIVVVNNFADREYSRIIALGNCATGRTDWLNKGQEAAPAHFWKFFLRSPVDLNVCITFVGVPFMMDDDDKSRKLWHNSISFDRLRICEYVSTVSDAVMEWLNQHKAEALEVSLI